MIKVGEISTIQVLIAWMSTVVMLLVHLFSLSTRSNVSRKMSACWDWKMSAGRTRIVWFPHPAALIPVNQTGHLSIKQVHMSIKQEHMPIKQDNMPNRNTCQSIRNTCQSSRDIYQTGTHANQTGHLPIKQEHMSIKQEHMSIKRDTCQTGANIEFSSLVVKIKAFILPKTAQILWNDAIWWRLPFLLSPPMSLSLCAASRPFTAAKYPSPRAEFICSGYVFCSVQKKRLIGFIDYSHQPK